jgi:hypothetical protein
LRNIREEASSSLHAGDWVGRRAAETPRTGLHFDGRVTGYMEIWERAEAEKQPQILPPRYASRQDDSV